MIKNLTILFFSLFSVISFGQTNKTIKVTENEIKPVENKTIHYSEVTSDDVPVQDAQPIDDNYIYNLAVIDIQPEFPGGKEKMFQFISKNLIYSDEMINKQIKGKVFASFVVEKNGKITDGKIIRDSGFGTGPLVIKVLKKMPLWKPGMINGKTVRCAYLLPITLDATKQK
jgi:Gram-negative bacterial TonB protein C-terminal